jgi:Bacterial Ig-like domain (group 3)/FlgD Ig-like domain
MVARNQRRMAPIFAAVLLSLTVVGPVSADDPIPTSVGMAVLNASPIRITDSITIHIDLGPVPDGGTLCGTIHIYEITTGPDQLRSNGSGCYDASGAQYVFANTWAGLGEHVMYPTFTPSSSSYAASQGDQITFEVDRATSWTLNDGPYPPAEAGTPFTLRAYVGSAYADATGSVSIWRVGEVDPVCTEPLATGHEVHCTVAGLPQGSYTFYAAYGGTTYVEPSESSILTVEVGPNLAHGSASLQYAKFYPHKDGYRDTVEIRGQRDEDASVVIKIYKPSGALLKTVNLALGSGEYSWTWNGRKSSGTLLPEGKYKVKQTLMDALGATKTITGYVTLSHKVMRYHTKSITVRGSSADASGYAFAGTVRRNTTAGWIRLRAPDVGWDWAGAGWQFTIPSATIYTSLKVKIYGRHSGPNTSTDLGAQNFAICPYKPKADWNIGCSSGTVYIPATSGTKLYWYSTGALSSSFRAGKVVRAMVSTVGGTTYIYKARVTVKYGVLGY